MYVLVLMHDIKNNNAPVNYRERGFLARYNPRGVSRRKHPESRRPEGWFLRAILPRDVSR